MSDAPITPAERPHHTLRLLDAWDATPQLRALRLERPRDFGYHTPGQYIALTTGDLTPRYFALASSHLDPDHIELLVKRDGDTALALADLAPGARVSATDALGAGFHLDAMRGRHLLLFASGSGLAPILPLLDLWRRQPQTLHLQSVWLYYGADRAEELARPDPLLRAEAHGAHILRAAVATPEATAGFAFVQDAFAAHAPPLRDAAAVLCGSPRMEAAVEPLLLQAGLPPARILRNY